MKNPRHQKCPFCFEYLNKLLSKEYSGKDRYLNNVIYCYHCNLLFYGIKNINELKTRNNMIISLEYSEKERRSPLCGHCHKKKFVVFYRQTRTVDDEKIRSKKYLYGLRHCQKCKKIYFNSGINGFENFSLPVDFQEKNIALRRYENFISSQSFDVGFKYSIKKLKSKYNKGI